MSEKDKAVNAALQQIEKQYGKGAVMRLGDDTRTPVAAISTGCLGLDLALGVGGLPRGRVCEIFGPESSGKTTLVYHVIAEAQRKGGVCAFIDAEHAMDPTYARNIGVDVDNLLVSQPDNGEQALEIAEMLIRSGGLDVVAIDSVAALVPRAEIEGEMGDSFVGLQARLMSQALRKLTGVLNRTGTVAIFTNQLREKIGVMFGSPETTTGGRALKFYSSVRLDIRRIETLKDGTDAIGNRVRVKVVRASSTSSTAPASRGRAPSSMWRSKTTSSRSPVRTSPSRRSASARAARTCAGSSTSILTCWTALPDASRRSRASRSPVAARPRRRSPRFRRPAPTRSPPTRPWPLRRSRMPSPQPSSTT
jgi:recombination protein RecA